MSDDRWCEDVRNQRRSGGIDRRSPAIPRSIVVLTGRLDARDAGTAWHTPVREIDLLGVITDTTPSASLRSLSRIQSQRHPQFGKLIDALGMYRVVKAKGGWLRVPDGEPITADGTSSSPVSIESARCPDRKMPVYILYWTAFENDDGRVNFREDIYENDSALLEALDALVPAGEGISCESIVVALDDLSHTPGESDGSTS